jgi:alpha-1,6-mannosyltransferase
MRNHLLDWGVERVALQPLGVDTAAFHPERAAAASWRSDLGLAGDARVLVYAGRFAPEKHLDVLAAAVARLGSPHVLLAIGDGPVPPAGARVRVVPFIADVPRLASILAGADAFVHAGDQETFGLSARGDGLRHADRRAPAEGLAELADGTCSLAVERGTGGVRGSDRRAAPATDRRNAARLGTRRGQRLGAGAPALLGHYRRLLDGRAARLRLRRRRGARSLVPPHDERRNDAHPSRFASERFVCVVLHDVAPRPAPPACAPSPPSPRSPTCR